MDRSRTVERAVELETNSIPAGGCARGELVPDQGVRVHGARGVVFEDGEAGAGPALLRDSSEWRRRIVPGVPGVAGCDLLDAGRSRGVST